MIYALRIVERLGHQAGNDFWPIGGWIYRWQCRGEDCHGPCVGADWRAVADVRGAKLFIDPKYADCVANKVLDQYHIKCEVVSFAPGSLG